jgi:histidine triad (HIT) family protein
VGYWHLTPGVPDNCQFCKIASKEVPAEIILEDDATLAFLDYRPLFPGHVLLIPKAHVETLPDLPSGLLPPLFAAAQLLARAVEEGLEADGSFLAINNRISQSVPHLHIHVVPRRRKDGLKGFFWPRQKYESAAAMAEVAERLRIAVARVACGSMRQDA